MGIAHEECENKSRAPFPYKEGDRVRIRGTEYTVGSTHLKYLLTSGDPEALYAVLSSSHHVAYIMTHKRIIEECPPKLVERIVTVAQIIGSEPCQEGLYALGLALGVYPRNVVSEETSIHGLVYRISCWAMVNGSPSFGIKVSDLYTSYTRAAGHEPATSWLLFLARVLNLVPDESKGPDRATLKRLLGIA